ncbi:hypothetical protein PHJA_002163000 [Phtheirospermum japonicum]|uniref:Transmembrane protein n=1 Tax=Phtheirospermum japonicum TaxID=374723 RepID=A0A830CMI6_9LAMI|nr:hypothetical protein PHJA_002163000 [Phtheirospermum japonicum]
MAASADGGTDAHSADASTKCSCGSKNCTECTRRQSSTSSLPSSSSSCSLLSFDSYPVQDYDKPWRVFTASVKGFAIGAGLKGGLAIFALLTRLRRRRLLPSSKKVKMASISADVILALKETLRYGMFLGTFAGTFVSDRKVEVFASRCNSWTVNAADWVEHTAHKLGYLHSHACHCIGFPVWDKEQEVWSYMSAYILKQDSLPLSYKSFLNKHGAKDSVILNGVREIASGLPVTNLEAIEQFYESNGVNIKLDPQMKIPCSALHNFMERPLWYCKVKLVSLNVLFICLEFRVSFRTRIWTCILFKILKRCNIPMVAIGTFPTGLALAIEKKSRRIEISLYCLARAIESFFTCIADAGYLSRSKNIKRADVVTFSISTAIIMHCYAMERDVFRSKYLNVLDWVFGVPLPPYVATPRKNQ